MIKKMKKGALIITGLLLFVFSIFFSIQFVHSNNGINYIRIENAKALADIEHPCCANQSDCVDKINDICMYRGPGGECVCIEDKNENCGLASSCNGDC